MPPVRRRDALLSLLAGPALALAGLALPWRARAQSPGPLETEGPFRVAEILDGDTLVLGDGRRVRLVGIQAPQLPRRRQDFEAWPLADEAKAALAALALGQSVTLGFGGRRSDRHGRILAHVFLPDGRWLQGELLASGLARVLSLADNRAAISDMLALEQDARTDGRGIWALNFYRVRSAEEAALYLGRLELVEGKVLTAAVVRGRGYLNFAKDWQQDFTVSLAPDVRRLFESEGLHVENYQGLRIRVRGWLKSYNGPMIEVTHPEQIEVLP